MSATERTNIVLIHWHDLGRHLGTYGAKSVTSPVLDALATRGIRFDQAYCTAPLCSPARGSIFTGRYPHSNGLMGLAHLGWSYAPSVATLPGILSERGWSSALIGLQHESGDPTTLGYDETIGTQDRACGPTARRAGEWLAAHADDEAPFFLSVGFREVHRPYPATWYDPDDPASVDVPAFMPDNDWTRDDLAAFQGAIRTADESVGTILQALERAGIDDRTWVIFTTDHGMAFPGAKSTLYDPGIGVSLIMRAPSGWNSPSGATDRLISHVDLVPTVLDRLGMPIPAGVEGVSHAAWLSGTSSVPARAEVFAEKTYHDCYDPIRAIRTQRFSYIVNVEERPALILPVDMELCASRYGFWEDGDPYLADRPGLELYDLASDPLQRHNVAEDAEYADQRADLAGRLAEWQQCTGDPLLHGPVARPPWPRETRFGALVPPFRPAAT